MRPLGTADPTRVGAYSLRGRLGGGAMGTVYLGTSPGGRAVAVKVARTDLADDPEFRERFRREVAMARSVGGFWTAGVVDADPEAPQPWLATEYVVGPTLQQAVSEYGPLPAPAVRRLAAGLTEALQAIHAAGLVHRDLKPSNVLLAADGPRVIDFGISQALEGVRLTATGEFLGTPGFLAPEQISGAAVGPATDLFALGAVLVFAATGRGPFGTGPTDALMYRAMHDEPTLDGLPPELVDVVRACLDRDPARRPTPGQVLDRIGGIDPPGPDGADWLPAPVRTLVQQYATNLHTTPAAEVPAAEPPAPAIGGGTVRFRTNRLPGLIVAACQIVVGLALVTWAGQASDADPVVRVVAVVAFVVLFVLALRHLVRSARRGFALEVSRQGLVAAKGRRRWQIPWETVARVRVVGDRAEPWVVVWLVDGWTPPRKLAGRVFRGYHGGYRLYPVGHQDGRRSRAREIDEVRSALAWHARRAFDSSV
ncbi:serine/threonine-protein kinase [Actinopolymorpha singaporensis]|uniref:Serine/threonine protein kinase n=1 Tax=Actinopolymorpha singaporensis TaxID=117157 RepID=A0A1H1PQ71_9ACTN|nr:serine/threonine-protein kinase [Actinopolymorpha singaporensis]SDS13245.1 Serine/threonine protein kinase [Actinopolymorpha singaporensis]